MATPVHEGLLARVVTEIQNKLKAFANTESQSKAFAQNIEYAGSPKLYLSGNNNDGEAIINRCPDAIFEHRDAHWPGVIIEVSYSQKRKDLPHLADDYILETNGSVCVVVGLDIDYKTKKGTISMWRPRYVTNEQGQLELRATQTLDNEVRRSLVKYWVVADIEQVFRDETGDPNLSPNAGLRLELKDFAPGHLAEGISESFLISSAMLCQFLNKAEERYQKTKEGRGVVLHLPAGAKKRRREETPPEVVSSDDDHTLPDDDSSYKPSP